MFQEVLSIFLTEELSIYSKEWIFLPKIRGTYYYENDPVYQRRGNGSNGIYQMKANEIADLLRRGQITSFPQRVWKKL